MDYIKYLAPSGKPEDIVIQWIFLVVIIALCGVTAIWVKKTANSKGWEARWNNRTEKKEDDFDVEHGSVLELSEAVATPAERFADVLPSMLLVIGLLGTFWGIGTALMDATDVISGEASSEKLLKGMEETLGGLGTLFRTSVYGIISFFLFTFWKSKFGTNDKRFRWCVEKCNSFLKKKRDDAQKNTADIIETLNGMSQSIGDSLGDCIRNSLQTALVDGFKGVQKNLVNMNSNLCKTLEDTVVARFRALEGELKLLVKESEQSVDKMTSISNDMNGLMQSMDGLSTSMKNNFAYVAKSAQVMGAAAQNMGVAANNLSESVNAFEPSVKATLEKIQTEFVASIDKSTGVMNEAGNSIRGAVSAMAEESHKSQEKINETLEKFKNDIKVILNDVKNATTAVQEISGITQESMTDLSDKIDGRLNAISRANLKIDDGMRKLPESLSGSIVNSLAPIQESIERASLKVVDALAKMPNKDSTVPKITGKSASKI